MNQMKIHTGFCIWHSINNKVEQVNHNLWEANLLGSFRSFSRRVQIPGSCVKMLPHHSTSRFTFGVKQNHEIIDWLQLNNTSGHPPSCSDRATCLPRTMARQFLRISSDGDSTTFLGNLCHWSGTLTVFKCSEETSCVSVHCFFSCHWVPLRAWIHFFAPYLQAVWIEAPFLQTFRHIWLTLYLLRWNLSLAEVIFEH